MKKPLRLFEIDPCWSNSSNQTWANNSTWYCYSEITQKLGKIWGQIPGRIRGNNLPQVKYIDRVRLKNQLENTQINYLMLSPLLTISPQHRNKRH